MAQELFSTSLFNDAALQAYYRFENSLNDSGPNAYNLTNSSSTDTASGEFSHGRAFASASSQYASDSGTITNIIISGSQTWNCWVNMTTISNYMCPMDLASSTGLNRRGFLVGTDNGNSVYFELTGLTTNSQVLSSNNSLGTGSFHMLTGVYNSVASTLAIYIDGVLNNSVTASGSPSALSSPVFAVGARAGSPTFYMNGTLDDAAIFSRVLTTSEIYNLYWGTALFFAQI